MVTLWAVGDSNTDPAGVPAYRSRSWYRRFTDRVAGESAGAGLVVGQGVGGSVVWAPDGSPHPRISDWLPQRLTGQPRPKRILVLGGTNNLHATGDGDLPALFTAWDALHERIETDFLVQAFWLPVPPIRISQVPAPAWPGAWESQLMARRAAINSWLRTSMAPRGRLIDIPDSVLGGPDGRLRADCDSGDGVHLGTLGHVRLADALPLWLGIS